MKTRTLQQTFDAVIKSGCYRSRKPYSRDYMCHALDHAYVMGIITRKECNNALKSIDHYLQDYALLKTALRHSGYGNDPKFSLCKAIYSCWSARPKLKHNLSI